MWIDFGKRGMRKGVGINDRENNKVFERKGVNLRGGRSEIKLYARIEKLVKILKKKRNKRRYRGKRGESAWGASADR
ncbi:MAG: hypothetical protein NZ530_01950 [Thermodesulfobacteriaceae bacterium]|nr:hypothetical protein [Thermodesulfobacteriaceae bacterium]